MRLILTCTLFTFFNVSIAFAQTSPTDSVWTNIETSIKTKTQLEETLKTINAKKEESIRANNDITLARCWYYTMLIRDLKTEDSLYFRNSAFIDSLLINKQSSPLLKTAMHLMQARRIFLFERKYLKFRPSTYETKNLQANYGAMNVSQRDSLVRLHFKKALQQSNLTNKTNDIAWLSFNANKLLFKADLADIALAEQIGFETGKINKLNLSEQDIQVLIKTEPRAFQTTLQSSLDTAKIHSNLMDTYALWMRKHNSKPEELQYIQMLVKYYLYSRMPNLVSNAWTVYLQKNLSSPFNSIHATAAFYLFQQQYYNGIKYGQKFDVQYKGKLKQAVQLYEQHQNVLNEVPLYKKTLENLLKKIKNPEIKVQVTDLQMTATPILLKVKYRSVQKIYYRIVKIGVKEEIPNLKTERIEVLLNRPVIRDSSFLLPAGADDFDKHALYLKLDSLPLGRYNVVFSPAEIKDTANLSQMECIQFQVSDIAVVNTRDQFIVLNRKTGFPMSGVKATELLATQTKKQVSSSANGFISVKQRPDSKEFMFIAGKDTLTHYFNRIKDRLPRDIYNTKDYHDLEEFYDDQARLQIYTDRGIYRPGQRVQYKIVMLSRDPSTGESIIFSKANKYFKNWLAQNKPLLKLKDPNYKTVDSVKLVPDDYGSFSGSFLIPKNGMTGSWSIDGDVIDYDNGNFKVEEYKRPTMELTMEKPADAPLPGEPFDVKLKVKSLSGADLNHVKISYQVIRESNYFGNNIYINPIVTDTLGYTDEKGMLVIKVNDVNLPKKNLDNPDKELVISYRLSATATEATGESISQENTFYTSSWPINIHIPAANQYDRKNLPKLNISAKTENSKFKVKEIHVSIFQNIEVPDTARSETIDQWLYTKDQLKVWFPNEESLQKTRLEKKLVLEKTIPVDSTVQFQLDKTLLKAGMYEFVATTSHSGKISGLYSFRFDVFDSEQRETPGYADDFNHLSLSTARPGDKLDYQTATVDSAYVIYGLTYYTRQKQGIAVKTTYQTQYQAKGMQTYSFTIPKDALQSVVITKAYVLNNKLYNDDQDIYLVPPASAKPEIVIEKYRKVLAPGTKEIFVVSVKTEKQNIAAQLMTGMYDAALDKLASHQWSIPGDHYFSGHLRDGWSRKINDINYNYYYWTRNKGSNNQNEFIDEYEADAMLQQLRGRVAGLPITPMKDLDFEEKLLQGKVAGFSIADVPRYATTGSTIVVKGINSLVENAQPLIIVDGVPYAGSLKDFDAASVTDAMVLKGADAAAIYGSKAANGVLIISTKGKIVLPAPPEPQPMVRKDFSETAFFYPKVYADKNGLYSFTFTMPQTATAWNWKLMAHTKSGLFAYAERKLNTRLDLIVQPNMPRLLYQGDGIVLKSRISNQDTTAMDVKLSCKIEDAVTGEDLTAKILKEPAIKIVKVAGKVTETAGFAFKVPEGQLNPLTIVTTVNGGALADAEEHTLPILPKKVFMRKQIPLVFSKKDSLVQAPKLPEDADLYGLSLYVDSKPQAALINSLPFLANYSFNCSEQVFNKLYARITANQLMRNQPELAKSFKKDAQYATSDTTEPKLPDELAEAAMPWLNLTNQTAKQQKQLYQVLDTLSNKTIISGHLDKLYAMQDFQGGLPWFEGGQSNIWISNYVLKGFGKLNQQGWESINYQKHSNFIRRLIAFTDSSYTANNVYDNLFCAYSRSFWKKEYPLSPAVIKKVNTTLELAEKEINNRRLYDQALWIIVSLKYTTPGDQIYKKALAQLSNIQQRAIHDERNGMRWKEISDGDDLNYSKEETIAMLYEAFTEAGQNTNIANGLSKWMLSARQDYSWRTTTGTAAAIDMLKESAAIKTSFVPDSVSAKVDNQQMSSSNGLLAGQRNQFISLNKVSPVTVSANNAINGGITWHYFSAEAQAYEANNKVKLKKTLFSYDQQKNTWGQLSEKSVLKIGERVKIVLTIETQVSLRFVQVEDKRAGVFEPVDGNSGHNYQDRIRYYKSVRDAGQQLFIDFLPSGRSELSYEVTVTQEGTFKNGAAILQCLYNPGVTAYSNAMTIVSKP